MILVCFSVRRLHWTIVAVCRESTNVARHATSRSEEAYQRAGNSHSSMAQQELYASAKMEIDLWCKVLNKIIYKSYIYYQKNVIDEECANELAIYKRTTMHEMIAELKKVIVFQNVLIIFLVEIWLFNCDILSFARTKATRTAGDITIANADEYRGCFFRK